MRKNRAERKTTYGSLIAGMLSVLFCLTLISFWMLGNLYAKYVTQGNGSDDAVVAVFDISDSNTLTKDFAVSLNGIKSEKINVTISNKSEVAVRYRMEFISDGNLPLDIQAAAVNGENTVTQEGGSWIWTSDKEADGHRTTPDEYEFTIKLQDAGYQFSGGVEHLTLTVTAEQTD